VILQHPLRARSMEISSQILNEIVNLVCCLFASIRLKIGIFEGMLISWNFSSIPRNIFFHMASEPTRPQSFTTFIILPCATYPFFFRACFSCLMTTSARMALNSFCKSYGKSEYLSCSVNVGIPMVACPMS